MTNQEKKAYLRRYTSLNKAIGQKLVEIEQQRTLCEKVTATLTGMPRGGGSNIGDRYAKLVDMMAEVNREIDAYVDMRQEVVEVIRTVPGITYQTLLNLRYINGHTWEQIAVEMNYSYMQVCRIHGKALDEIML